ncbi:MAG: response regulator, partial [Proteobacteria bacterium]|nr:response regulator [Pseudomonadota bacterium]
MARYNDIAAQKRVLVVDDDVDFALPELCTVLEEDGYHVTGANNSKEALKRLREAPFQVLLTDMKMPLMNGLELAAAASRYDPFVVPIVVTEFATMDMAIGAMRRGVFDFVPKDTGHKGIVAAVERAVSHWNLRWSRSLKDIAPAKVLLVRAPGSDRRFYGWLHERPDFEVVRVESLGEALKKLTQGDLDLVVSELYLDDSFGLATLSTLLKTAGSIPVVVIGRDVGQETASWALERGTADYLVTDGLTGPIFASRLKHAIDRHRLLNKVRDYAGEIRASSLHHLRIVEGYADPMVVLNGSQEVLFVNPAAERLYGTPVQQLVGTQYHSFPEVGQSMEFELDRADKKKCIAEMRTTKVAWEGEDTAFLVALRDV